MSTDAPGTRERSPLLRRLWALDSFAYGLRVFIALASVMALCWQLGRMELAVPLFLGTVACALAETDDNWRGRLQTLLLTLVCFALAAFAVQGVFHQPWAYVGALALAAFVLTLLGAISRRYQAIGYGTLILWIYATIGMDQRIGTQVQPFWMEPALLLAGAAWYGLLSVLWCALFVHQPVQQALAGACRELGAYLRLKATLFEPVLDLPMEERRIALAQQSGRVVLALNNAKESIFERVDRRHTSARMQRYLQLYFVVQDIHDRASSSHHPYDELADAFFHSDVLFRCQRLLRLQGEDCRHLARALLLRRPFERRGDSARALRDLQASLDWLARQQRAQWAGLLQSLQALARNLAGIDADLRAARDPGTAPTEHDGALFDRSPRNLAEAWQRVRRHLGPASPVFRHALRLAAALVVGYGLMQAIHAKQGFWILLTTVFVCQPGFGATRSRVVQRVAGTLLGLLAGWALFDLFPSLLLQTLFAVVAGVMFFVLRTRLYWLATAAMTLVVLMCFNQIGDGYDLIVPRLVDTLLGSAVAAAAVFLVLPDWRTRRLPELARRTLAALAAYLRALMAQYAQGRRDDLPYRLARRNAHNADAALSSALAAMMQEPQFVQHEGQRSLRLLLHTHTLLNYLSGLGAHRTPLAPGPGTQALMQSAGTLAGMLDQLAGELGQDRGTGLAAQGVDALAAALDRAPDAEPEAARLARLQLRRACEPLAALRAMAAETAVAS